MEDLVRHGLSVNLQDCEDHRSVSRIALHKEEVSARDISIHKQQGLDEPLLLSLSLHATSGAAIVSYRTCHPDIYFSRLRNLGTVSHGMYPVSARSTFTAIVVDIQAFQSHRRYHPRASIQD